MDHSIPWKSHHRHQRPAAERRKSERRAADQPYLAVLIRADRHCGGIESRAIMCPEERVEGVPDLISP